MSGLLAVNVAMELEAQPFFNAMTVHETAEVAGLRLYLGSPREDNNPRSTMVLCISGIGLVNAARAATHMLTTYDVDLLVSAGTAGGLAPEVNVGDVCVATNLAFTDADATVFGYERGQIPGSPAVFNGDDETCDRVVRAGSSPLMDCAVEQGKALEPVIHTGQMLAGNSFITQANVADTREVFPHAVSTDMESTALAQVAHAYDVKFQSVRGISDLCGPAADQDFHLDAELAAARSAAVVLAALA
ncbi:5'-methylthioadenosine/S-adenosylhomocysteine nucleosidase [Actinomyces vulturis]|uniref:5'-methylthioadenosine/S-adenosylhomocysteine nucleosidase n=1 Tax=Actinomyces vulturis TaxID=1857645 RepID=UPI000833798B|nr:5'-methylthioadenosine/S-adenosylhomocysteine nucleosidase [Actinomyces vulturis]